MANLKPNEKRLYEIDSNLKDSSYNYDVQKVKVYLTALLTKCLEALAEKDYNKYNLAEAVLNENLVRIGSSIENFEEFYSALKNEVAIDFLKQLLGVENISVLAANNPIEAVIITPKQAEEIKKIWEYIQYSANKKEIYEYWKNEMNYKTFENEAYTVLFNLFFIVIIDKNNINGTYLDTNYNFKLGLQSEIDVLEGFVTNRPELITPLTITERLIIAENEAEVDNDVNYISWSLEEDEIIYYNENEAFLVLVNDSFYYILNKKTGKSINFYLQHYQKDLFKTVKFLADFSDYCLGVKGTLKEKEITKKEPEEVLFQGIKQAEVTEKYTDYILDPTEETVENDVEENVPTDEEGVLENG